MGNAERSKGRRGEEQVGRVLRDGGWTLERLAYGGDWRAWHPSLPQFVFHVEVKFHKTLRLPLWRRQALREHGQAIPAVAYRRHGEPWSITWHEDDVWWTKPLDAFATEHDDAAMHAAPEREAAPSDRETGA